MMRTACPAVRSSCITVLFIAITLTSCGRRSPEEGLSGVPLSAELRPAVEASRRSLKTGDRGDPQVRVDLDRYYGLWEMFAGPDRRAEAADSLFALWDADPEHLLWPELGALNRNRLQNDAAFQDRFSRPGFADSSTALGAYLREWEKLRYGSTGEGFRRAWAARAALSPWQRTWIALRMSRLERRQGRADEATRFALEALPAARELGGWRLEMEAWLQLVRALRLGDHLDDALHAAEVAERLARAVSRETGNVYIVQNARLERAEVLAARREVAPALRLYADCADSAWSHGLVSLAGQSLNWAGIVTAATDDYEAGLGLYRRSLAMAKADGDSLYMPRHLTNLARRHRLLGNLDSCRVYLREAERWIAAYPDPGNRARFPLIQAEYYAQIGDFVTVDSLLAVAVNLRPNLSSIEALAELHLELARQEMERGRPDQAYRSIAVLDSLRDRLGTISADRNELFDLDLASAAFLARQGLFVRAVEALDRADAALQRRPDPRRLWELTRARGNVARRRGDHPAAEAAYRACLTVSEERRDPDRLAESRLLLGSLLLDQGRFDEVQPLFPRDTAETFGGRFRTRLSTILLCAMAESRGGRFENALRELERARSFCRPGSPPDLLARLDLETGRAEAGRGHRERAHAAYARVRERLAPGGSAFAPEPTVFLDRDVRRELAEAILTLAVAEPGPEVRGAEAAAALQELQAFLPEWQRTGSRGADRLVQPQIIYFVGAEASFRWTVADGGVALCRLPGEATLLKAMAPVLADLQRPSRPAVPAEIAALAEVLGGLPSGWPAGSALTVVPDGPLFSIPWPALPESGAAGGSWIDRGPVALADGPSYREEPIAPTERRRPRLLALGVDETTPGRDAGLATLHCAEREARDVHALWPAGQATLRVGDAADWRTLAGEELSNYEVIHIASHALVYQGMADRTTLMLAGSGGDPVTSTAIRKLDLHAELVFLSCCEAAEGVRRGVGPAHAGLARSFLAAGAHAVIAPSARIEDEAARQLAGRFYGHWLEGLSVEAALRRAQLDLRDGGARWAHPCYWAFYQTIGA